MARRLTPDFCWEGRLICTASLLALLYLFTALRFKALRGISYPALSPRGLSGAAIILVNVFCTAYAGLVIWTYTKWYSIRELREQGMKEKDDALIAILRSRVPKERKTISFVMRMMLVTVLWLVKASFVLIFYDFPNHLPKRTRWHLHITSLFMVVSYAAVWAATVADLSNALKREGFSPMAGGGVLAFTPVNTWAGYAKYEGDPQVSSLIVAEIVITVLNVVTDLLLISLVYFVFRHLNLAPGRRNFRAASLLTSLFMLFLAIAFVRLAIISTGMTHIAFRLAFDTLTDFEAFIAGCAASIPAMRVLMRDGRAFFSFPESWGSMRGLRKSMGGMTFSSYQSRSTMVETQKEGTVGVGVSAMCTGGPGARGLSMQMNAGAHWCADFQSIDGRLQQNTTAHLAPVGTVEPITVGSIPVPGAEFDEVPWEELAARGIH